MWKRKTVKTLTSFSFVEISELEVKGLNLFLTGLFARDTQERKTEKEMVVNEVLSGGWPAKKD